MLTNETRRQLLNRAKAAQFPGSILEVYRAAEQGIDILADHETQMQQQMQVAQTPQEQQTGLREEHAQGNTQASMAFPDVQPGQSFNTVGMKAPINVDKYDNQGHLVESYKNVPPGIKNLPTGPYEGTVIETPAEYKKGGVKDSNPQQYQVEVIKYPLGYKNMPPGHIESRVLNVDDLPEEYGNVAKQLNPWPEGNRGVYYSPERNYAPGVETTVLSLNRKDLETYLDAAQKGDYNFLSNNCADQTCAAFGLDQSKYTALGVTTPQQVFDALKNDPRAVKKSTTGDATIVEDTLKNVNKVVSFSPAKAVTNLFNTSAEAFKKAAESKKSAKNKMKDGGYKKYQTAGEKDNYSLDKPIAELSNLYSSDAYGDRLRKEYANAHNINLSDQEVSNIQNSNVQAINTGNNPASPIPQRYAKPGLQGILRQHDNFIGLGLTSASERPAFVTRKPNFKSGHSGLYSTKIHEVAHRANAGHTSLLTSSNSGSGNYIKTTEDFKSPSKTSELENYYKTFFTNAPASSGHSPNYTALGMSSAASKNYSDYLLSAPEIKSQKKELESALKAAGIWDASSGPFTQDHIEKLRNTQFDIGGDNPVSHLFKGLNIPTIRDPYNQYGDNAERIQNNMPFYESQYPDTDFSTPENIENFLQQEKTKYEQNQNRDSKNLIKFMNEVAMKKNLEKANASQFAQDGGYKRKTSNYLDDLEDKVNEKLGHPMDEAFNYSAIPNYNVVAPQYRDLQDKIDERRYEIFDQLYDQRHYTGFDEKIEKARSEDPILKDLLTQEKALTSQYPTITRSIREIVDSHRHTAAGYKTSKAIENKVKNVPYIGGMLDKIGADKLAGFLGSNLFGMGHEAMTLIRDTRPLEVKAKESYEDIYNNAMGSLIAASGKSEDDAMRTIFGLEKQGRLKQGQVETPTDNTTKQKGGFENVSQTNYKQDLENVYKSNFKDKKEQAPKDFKKRLRIPESSNGVNMINKTSTATGLYGQLFSEIKDMPELKGITREEFAADTTLQNQLLDMRWRGDIPGVRGLKENVKHYREKYSEQTKDFTNDELAALSHFLGRQGGRKYFASIRDNKPFKVPGVNKTPKEYIKEYRKGKKRGGYKPRFL